MLRARLGVLGAGPFVVYCEVGQHGHTARPARLTPSPDLLDSDESCRHGEVADHHDADDDALGDDEAPVVPARDDQGRIGEQEAYTAAPGEGWRDRMPP